MKRIVHSLVVATVIAASLAACPHRATAAPSTPPPPPPPPPPPGFHITKYVDLATPKFVEILNIVSSVLYP
jgi:hypothetical protein